MKKDFKILLVFPKQNQNIEPDFSYVFPFGLGYISSVLKNKGYDVDCLNLNHYKGTTEQLISKVLDQNNYDFVGVGGNALVYKQIEEIIKTVKKHQSRPKIILGGAIIIPEPETVFNLLKPDFAVIGEGEEIIIDLLDCIEKSKNLEEVKGIGFVNKEDKLIFTEQRPPIDDLDTLPSPDFEGFELEKKLNNSYCNNNYVQMFDYPREYPIMGSRGCPFNCTFCYHYSRYRKRSIKSILDELKTAVKKYRINFISFYDECLAIDKERLFAVCNGIKEIRESIAWDLKWMPALTVHNIDEETLKVLKDSGADMVGYGFESFSPIVLKSMRKPITPELIETAFNKTLKAGIAILANFIFGDAAETKETAKVTLDWWKKNAKGQINLGFIQPYPGSAIYKHCLKKGVIKDKADFIENGISRTNWYNMTNEMTDEEIKQLKKDILDAESKYFKFVRPISMKKIDKNVYTIKVKCPFCGEIMDYGNCFIKNKLTFGFTMNCRKCPYNFHLVGSIRKMYYKHYSKLIHLKEYKEKILKSFKK